MSKTATIPTLLETMEAAASAPVHMDRLKDGSHAVSAGSYDPAETALRPVRAAAAALGAGPATYHGGGLAAYDTLWSWAKGRGPWPQYILREARASLRV